MSKIFYAAAALALFVIGVTDTHGYNYDELQHDKGNSAAEPRDESYYGGDAHSYDTGYDYSSDTSQ